MAYKEKRKLISIPPDLAAEIKALNLPGSLNELSVWLLRQAVEAQKEKEANK
jgi:hypothetical protein